MSERVQAFINPAILLWAREQRGFPLEAAAERLHVTSSKLAECEAGTDQLSIPQLRKAADLYRRPMAVFYLDQVPRPVRAPVPDFRLLPEAADSGPSAELLLAMRRVREKQQAAAALSEYGPMHDWAFLGSVSVGDDKEEVAAKVRNMLGVTDTTREGWRNESDAFKTWRTGLESIGVLVFQMSGIRVEEMRGFSFARKPYPAIAINSADSPKARVFSLMHEFTHLLLNTPGLCNLRESVHTDTQVEAFCNYVAGATLIPKLALRSINVVRNHGPSSIWSEEELTKISNHFRVSQQVTLRRLLILDLTTPNFYQEKCDEWMRRPLPVSTGGFGETGAQKVLRTQGSNYVRLILDALHSEAITSVNVSEYLEMKLKHLSGLEQTLSQREVT